MVQSRESKRSERERERERIPVVFYASFRNDNPARKVFILVLKDLDGPELQPQNY